MQSVIIDMEYIHKGEHFDKLYLIQGYGNSIMFTNSNNDFIEKVTSSNDFWRTLTELKQGKYK